MDSLYNLEILRAKISHKESVEAKLHGESKVIQRCFDDNNDDNKR